MRLTAILAILIAAVDPASLKGAPESTVAIDIYNRDLAQVRDTRQVDLVRGSQTIDFTGIAPGIFGHTANVVPSGRGGENIRTLSLAYHYDLVSQEKLMDRYRGQWFSFSADDATYAGRLLRFDATHLFLQPDTGDVIVQVVERGKLKEMFYPRLPDGLYTRPTLRWEVNAAQGVKGRLVEISYLTTGITWMCDYRADLSDETLSLSANFTIANDLELDLEDATVTLVAGKVHRSDDPEGGSGDEASEGREKFGRPEAAAQVSGERFDEYYRYTLPRPVSLSAGQTLQVPAFEPVVFKYERRYLFPHLLDSREVRVKVSFQSGAGTGKSARPLPEGDVGFYRRDNSGALIFAGQDFLPGTPAGGTIELDLGGAFDLTARRTRLTQSRPTRDRHSETWRVDLRNGGAREAVVHVEQRIYGYATVESAEAGGHSVEPIREASDRVLFPVPVPAGSAVALTFTISFGY
ncbi:MAG: hypothetical protein FJY67_00270 [Calditrichaeota bacterium]|nr:hypothetical protein [Calditrichota bacterium]